MGHIDVFVACIYDNSDQLLFIDVGGNCIINDATVLIEYHGEIGLIDVVKKTPWVMNGILFELPTVTFSRSFTRSGPVM